MSQLQTANKPIKENRLVNSVLFGMVVVSELVLQRRMSVKPDTKAKGPRRTFVKSVSVLSFDVTFQFGVIY